MSDTKLTIAAYQGDSPVTKRAWLTFRLQFVRTRKWSRTFPLTRKRPCARSLRNSDLAKKRELALAIKQQRSMRGTPVSERMKRSVQNNSLEKCAILVLTTQYLS